VLYLSSKILAFYEDTIFMAQNYSDIFIEKKIL